MNAKRDKGLVWLGEGSYSFHSTQVYLECYVVPGFKESHEVLEFII